MKICVKLCENIKHFYVKNYVQKRKKEITRNKDNIGLIWFYVYIS